MGVQHTMLRVWHTQTHVTAAEVRVNLGEVEQCKALHYGWVRTLSPPLGVLTRGTLDPWYHIPSPRTPTEAV